MKNIWKWILGLVVVLVVVAGVAGLVFVGRNMMVANMAQRQAVFSARATALAGSQQGQAVPQGTPAPQAGPQNTPQNGPMMRPGFGPMQRGFSGWRGNGRMPMMQGRGFDQGGPGFYGARPFGMGSMILGGLARLLFFGVFILLLVGAYLLGQRSRARVAVQSAAPAALATHACPKCGQPVVDGSGFCPSCGEKQ